MICAKEEGDRADPLGGMGEKEPGGGPEKVRVAGVKDGFKGQGEGGLVFGTGEIGVPAKGDPG